MILKNICYFVHKIVVKNTFRLKQIPKAGYEIDIFNDVWLNGAFYYYTMTKSNLVIKCSKKYWKDAFRPQKQYFAIC